MPSSNLGWDLACGGDFNGDGLADLIAGRPGYANGSGNVGSLDVLLGLSDLSAWPFPGSFNGTVVGGGFRDLSAAEILTVAPAILLMFVLGVYPQALVGLIHQWQLMLPGGAAP